MNNGQFHRADASSPKEIRGTLFFTFYDDNTPAKVVSASTELEPAELVELDRLVAKLAGAPAYVPPKLPNRTAEES